MTLLTHDGDRARLVLLGLAPHVAAQIERDLRAAQLAVAVVALADSSADPSALHDADLVIVDPKSGSHPTADLLTRIRHTAPDAGLAVLTRHADSDDLYQVVRVGRIERYWVEPWSPIHAMEMVGLLRDAEAKRQRLQREKELADACARLADENQRLRSAGTTALDWSRFAQVSAAMRESVLEARKLAATDHDLCLVGEPGSGRGTLARAIHASSARAAEPFVKLPAALLGRRPVSAGDPRAFELESGLRIASKWEAAGHGTLFVANIEDLDDAAQAVLAGLVTGNVAPARKAPRLIASSSATPRELVAEGSLHPRLAEHLASHLLAVPSLRERREDLPALAAQLLDEWSERVGRTRPELTAAALDALAGRALDGNVAELRELLEEAAALARDGRIETL